MNTSNYYSKTFLPSSDPTNRACDSSFFNDGDTCRVKSCVLLLLIPHDAMLARYAVMVSVRPSVKSVLYQDG